MPSRTARAKLKTYRAKRKFDVTSEPSGDRTKHVTSGNSYVIQKHDARRLHYDFRLELDGVLLSWAVPKGPSLQPGARRLAARTEDHPLDYRDFEGIIPKGEYGGGTVVVWDRGTWEPEGDAREMMKRGRLTFTLHGEKLHGRWHLVRTRSDKDWLLFKSKDDAARTGGEEIVDERPESVITGRTVDEVARDADAVWHSNRAEKRKPPDLNTLVAQLPTDIKLTNLDKILWPDDHITKGQLLAYVAVTAEHALPFCANRPLTLVRCPDGVKKECWYQKHAGKGTPKSVRRVMIEEESGEAYEYMYVDDQQGLLAVAQLGALELHVWGSHVKTYEKPVLMVFDLDPDVGLAWDRVVEGAHALRARLDELGLESWVKTTGGKGLHVCVPIAPKLTWDELKDFSRGVAESIERAAPKAYTTNMAKARRVGRIFIDYLRNGRGATFIAPYSPRRRPGAAVSTPITWKELSAGIDPSSFTIATVPARLGAQRADPWKDLLASKQPVTAAARRNVR
ncbi:MAG TPA: non-homologous end-joining DNA ligase [Kofleriaceae bacterium]|nr:non-homologous end-joining DNA ligase [Kofleriaceae bacterium]